jgi:signal peptidase II
LSEEVLVNRKPVVSGWRIGFPVLCIFLLVADQAIKLWARHALAPGQSITVIPNVFDLTLTFNRGVAFGMLQGAGVFLAPVAIAIAIGALLYSYRHPKESPWAHVAMALLASGAIGNLYDRLVFGKVTDMFQVRAFNFPIFNLADSCITVAATILIIRWGAEAFTPHHAAPEIISPEVTATDAD